MVLSAHRVWKISELELDKNKMAVHIFNKAQSNHGSKHPLIKSWLIPHFMNPKQLKTISTLAAHM